MWKKNVEIQGFCLTASICSTICVPFRVGYFVTHSDSILVNDALCHYKLPFIKALQGRLTPEPLPLCEQSDHCLHKKTHKAKI